MYGIHVVRWLDDVVRLFGDILEEENDRANVCEVSCTRILLERAGKMYDAKSRCGALLVLQNI